MTTFPRELVLSESSVDSVLEICKRMSWRRIGVISGDTFEASCHFTDRLLDQSDEAIIRRWSRGVTHSPVEAMEHLASAIEPFRPHVLVSAGGGSTHDAAKGVNVLLNDGGPLLEKCLTFDPPDNLRFRPIPGNKLPLITVPSTFSGSESNGSAGFADPESHGKRVISDPSLVPHAVVIDPSLYLSVDWSVLMGSLMNAINHCIEGMASRRQSTVSDFLLPQALRKFSLLEIVRTPAWSEPEASDAATASAMAGIGLSGTWLGIAHAVGHVLGSTFGVPHGWCHAVMAGPCIRFNSSTASDAHSAAARMAGLENTTSEGLADWVDALSDALGLPRTLRDLGVGRGDLSQLAEQIWHDHDTYFNPRRIQDASEIEVLLEGCF